MPRNEVGEIVNNLPIEYMVAAPIVAAVKAQKEASSALAEFLHTVALDKDGNARMVTFKYGQEVQKGNGVEYEERYIQAPFVALSGIPNLSVESVQVNFELEVNTSDTNKSSSSEKVDTNGKVGFLFMPKINMSASLSHSSEQTRQTDTRAKYSFHVEARKQEQPEALMRIVDAITNASSVPTEQKPKTDNLEDKNTSSGGSGGSGT